MCVCVYVCTHVWDEEIILKSIRPKDFHLILLVVDCQWQIINDGMMRYEFDPSKKHPLSDDLNVSRHSDDVGDANNLHVPATDAGQPGLQNIMI